MKRAATAFGIGELMDEKEKTRWAYALVAACEAREVCVTSENMDSTLKPGASGVELEVIFIVEVERDGWERCEAFVSSSMTIENW